MAFLEMHFRSDALNQMVSVNVLVPDKKEKFKTLWLLHGLSDNHSAWMRYTSVERYAKEYQIAVVMPCVDRSWYTDTAYGKKYFTYITQELPEKMAFFFKGYSSTREDNIIMGLSMGGYGAIKSTLTYPEQYSFCAAFSGALDITRKNRPYDINEWRSIFGFELQSGDDLAGTKHDVFTLAETAKNLPFIYMWCGTEDSLIEVNKAFDAHLTQLGIDHIFKYSEGTHTWKYWYQQLKVALDLWNEQL